MQEPRCYDHRDRQTQPAGCQTCQRIAVEQDIVTRTVDALLAAGYALTTDEGDHRFYGPCAPSRDRATILSTLREVDDEHLGVFDSAEANVTPLIVQPLGWVRFVYGNDGYDVISDYTTNLEEVLSPVNDYAESLA